MYMRGAKVTYANELMKNAMMEFMSRELDLTNGMRITFRVHLSENQLIHIMVSLTRMLWKDGPERLVVSSHRSKAWV